MNESKLPALKGSHASEYQWNQQVVHVDRATSWGQQCYAAGVAAERERCAKIADAQAAYKPWNDHATCEVCEEIAEAIRKGETS